MTKVVASLVCCLALCGCDDSGPPAEWTFIQLTDNEFYDGESHVDGNNVVWISKERWSRSPDVYLYDGETIRALSTDGQDNFNPKISEGYVVWQARAYFQDVDGPTRERQYLQYYDGERARQIPGSPGVITYNISGRHVAWNGHLGGRKIGIFLFDGERTQLLAETENPNIYPDISGTSVVWINRNIFLHDGRRIRQLTTGDAHYQSPRIGGDSVIWSGIRYGEEEDMFLYDGSTVLQLTDSEGRDGYPSIGRTHAAWQGFDGNDWEVFLFDGQTVEQITNNDYDDRSPQVSGETVVWNGLVGEHGGSLEVFYYDGRTTTQLTDSDVWNAASGISGPRILCTHYDGNDREICLAIRKGAETEDELRRARAGTALHAGGRTD